MGRVMLVRFKQRIGTCDRKKCVDMHQGQIAVDSEVRGSRNNSNGRATIEPDANRVRQFLKVITGLSS